MAHRPILESDCKLETPFTCIVTGPSSGGKTWVVADLLCRLNEVTTTPPTRVIFFYYEYQNAVFDRILRECPASVEFVYGPPEKDGLLSAADEERLSNGSLLVVCDDMLARSKETEEFLRDVFVMYSHHRNLSIIIIQQKFYLPSDNARIIGDNTKYIIVLVNPRNKTWLRHLASQMWPGKASFLLDTLEAITSEKDYNPMLIDARQNAHPDVRVRSDFLSETPKAWFP